MGCRQGKLDGKKDEAATAAAAEGPAATADAATDPAAAAGGDEAKEEGKTDDSQKLIVVFGATGTQGGSVVKYLKGDENFKVRAVTRNAESEKAKQLVEQGVEVVVADLEDKDSLKKAIEGAYGVFLITCSPNNMDVDKEILQGKNAVEAAKECNVQHLVFSGAESAKELIDKECKPLEAKATIEKFIEEQKVPSTIVRYATYYENLINDELLKPKKNSEGEFVLDIPMGDETFDMICASESGECIHQIFSKGSEFIGQTIGLSSQRFKVEEYAAILSKAFDDKKFIAGSTTLEDFAKSDIPGATEYAKLFELFRGGKCERDIEITRRLNPSISPFEQWIDNSRDTIELALKSL